MGNTFRNKVATLRTFIDVSCSELEVKLSDV